MGGMRPVICSSTPETHNRHKLTKQGGKRPPTTMLLILRSIETAG
jgi:hypothetical protein